MVGRREGTDRRGHADPGCSNGSENEKLSTIDVRYVPQSIMDALSTLMEVGTLRFDEDGLSLRSTYGLKGQAVKTLSSKG